MIERLITSKNLYILGVSAQNWDCYSYLTSQYYTRTSITKLKNKIVYSFEVPKIPELNGKTLFISVNNLSSDRLSDFLEIDKCSLCN